MKHLRHIIKKLILQEELRRRKDNKVVSSGGMKTELEPFEKVFIEYHGFRYEITIKNTRTNERIAYMELSPIAISWEPGWEGRDDCFSEYSGLYLEVGPQISRADHGYGPLMYDIALEYAYQLGMYIVPDRSGVSDAASSMWKHYRKRRPDVKFVPFKEDHPCWFEDYDFDRTHLNGAYYKPNREYLDSLNVETPG